MVQAGLFTQFQEGHLGVGHTHEDIDGLLSIAKSAIDSAPVIENHMDVVRALQSKMKPILEKRGLDLQVEVIKSAACQS